MLVEERSIESQTGHCPFCRSLLWLDGSRSAVPEGAGQTCSARGDSVCAQALISLCWDQLFRLLREEVYRTDVKTLGLASLLLFLLQTHEIVMDEWELVETARQGKRV